MNEVKIVNKLWAILLLSILIVGCGGFRSTRNIIAVPSEEMTILKRTKGAATTKNNISVAAIYLSDVKQLDGFGVVIVNETSNWISIKQEECMLVQNGEVRHPIENTLALARLGSGYKPKMPNELSVDVYEWHKDINTRKSSVSSVNAKVVDEGKKLSIIAGSKENIFLYFNNQGNTAPMQLLIPNIYNETTKERTSFSFKFEVQKK